MILDGRLLPCGRPFFLQVVVRGLRLEPHFAAVLLAVGSHEEVERRPLLRRIQHQVAPAAQADAVAAQRAEVVRGTECGQAGLRANFRIVNMMKPASLFSRGMR